MAELLRSDPVDRDPDWDLLARVAGGDGAAFETLVERHHRRLLRVCERLLGDPEEARDAVQEVLLKVLRKAGGFRPQALVSTWLYRIAVNHCLNVLRRRRLVRMLSLGGGGEEEGGEERAIDPAEERPGPQRELAARREWRRVRRAIGALPPGQRAVLVLVRLEGLAYREVAATLGITLGAVESRLVRAMRTLERLREELEGGREEREVDPAAGEAAEPSRAARDEGARGLARGDAKGATGATKGAAGRAQEGRP